MKRIYRSIAVTVLAALMALPMVVRAEDSRPIVKEIQVTGLSGSKDVRLYVGETSKNVLDRYKAVTFKAKLPDTNELVDMELKAVGFYTQDQGYPEQKLPSDDVWPFDKTQDGLKLNENNMKFKTVFTLAFKDPELYTKYQFNSVGNGEKNTKLVFNGGEKLTSSRTENPVQNHKNIELLYFSFEGTIFRKFTFVADVDDTKMSKNGENKFSDKCETELQLEKTRSVKDCLKKVDEQHDNAAVLVQLPAGTNKYAVFLHDRAGNDKFVKNETNIITLGLDETSKANALETILKVRADENGKIPYIEAQDVTLGPDKKITAEELIKRAVKKLTPDVLTNPDFDANELKNVKAFAPEEGGRHHEFKDADIAAAKAKGPEGLEIEYQYTPTGYHNGSISAHAKLFVEPAAAPNPPAPVPQPQPKQQEKTGNTYFDLGRNFLPNCPDSKCAKAGTNAKKDDVPNTAAAANN